MILLQIHNLDSFRKIIIDSLKFIQKQQFDSLDYIGKIDSFYNNAWTKLSILFALIGVLIPLVINYIQVKRNEKDQANIKSDILTSLKGEMNKLLDTKVDTTKHFIEGKIFHILANNEFNADNYKNAFGIYVNALTCYFIGNDFYNFQNAFDALINAFDTVNLQILKEIQAEESDYYNIYKLLEKLENSQDDKYLNVISVLKKKLGSLK